MNKNELLTFPFLYGLIGYPLSHSFSKKYFAEKYKAEGIAGHFYELFPLESITELPRLITQFPNLKGLNVTIPYKELVLPYLDEIDEEAKAVGAVNTIKITEGKLKGYNTDIYGFEFSLMKICKQAPQMPQGAMILGTGGAAKAVAHVLKKLNISYIYVSRMAKPTQTTYSELNQDYIETYPLIINTTPLGMSPNTESCPDLPYPLLSERNVLYDLVYNPEKTLFLKKGAEQDTLIKNGLEMLHLQAIKAWEIWTESGSNEKN